MMSEKVNIYCVNAGLLNLIQSILPKINKDVKFRVAELKAFDLKKEIPGECLFLITESFYSENKIAFLNYFNKPTANLNALVITYGEFSEVCINEIGSDYIFAMLPNECHLSQFRMTLTKSIQYMLNRKRLLYLDQKLNRQTNELQELNNIGIALSAEHDMQQLLNLILQKAREITRSDAGTLYLVEKVPGKKFNPENLFEDKQLRFKLSHCDSKDFNFTEFTMPIQKQSLGGYVIVTGNVLNIPDAYEIPPDSEFGHNRSFDESVGYRTKSLLSIPMKTHQDELIGVLQLINRKRHWETCLATPAIAEQEVEAYDDHCVELATSLASQAAVAIENNRLYEEIKKLFDGFVLAAVHAIEQRDPTTSGHSERVAKYTLKLAEQVNQICTGPHRNVHLSPTEMQQIRYASLLHDFGKIGVRENVLVKAKKLYPHELELVINRFNLIKNNIKLGYSEKKLQALLAQHEVNIQNYLATLNGDLEHKILEVDNMLKLVIQTNEPTVLEKQQTSQLLAIGALNYRMNGTAEPYLSSHEIRCLSIPRGSLSEKERLEIESHVTHTYNFLKRIPWTQELQAVPEIAYNHHEKLDGSGYPRQLKGEEIPVQARMMTISDIYDALTAWDRPYKKAVPVPKALDILGYEEKAGKIDSELLRIFIEAEVYKIITPPKDALK